MLENAGTQVWSYLFPQRLEKQKAKCENSFRGRIYTSNNRPATTAGSTGRLIGRRGDDVMIEYVGDGRFDVLSYTGGLSFR